MSKKIADISDSDELFRSGEEEPVGTKCNNGSLVCGKLKPSKIGIKK